MKYRVRHITTYDYESPVVHGRHVARKRPRPLSFQSVMRSTLRVEPTPVWTRQEYDYYGNAVDVIEVLEPHENLVVTAETDVEVGPRPIDAGLPLFLQNWESIADRISRDPSCFEAREMQLDSPLVRRHPKLAEFARPTFTPGRPLFDALLELNERIYDEFTYDPGFSDIATPLGQVLRQRRGVCQDFAHVAIGALRSLGLAARYVSGYLETKPPPGRPRLVGADASHAWASLYFPDYGWVSFDPTNNLLPREQHVVVAWGRDFSEVSPLRGVVHGGGRHVVRVSVDVDPDALGPSAGGALYGPNAMSAVETRPRGAIPSPTEPPKQSVPVAGSTVPPVATPLDKQLGGLGGQAGLGSAPDGTSSVEGTRGGQAQSQS